MDDRTLDELERRYWTEGRSREVAQLIAEGILSRPKDRRDLLVLARALAVLSVVEEQIPTSFSDRIVELREHADSLRWRIKQVDLLGDEAIAPRSLFEVLGDELPELTEFDEQSLTRSRVGAEHRPAAAKRFLEVLGGTNVPAQLFGELSDACVHLAERADRFQSQALFESDGAGFVLGLHLERKANGGIRSWENVSADMDKQARIAVQAAMGDGVSVSWVAEWTAKLTGESIGLALYVAGLVDCGLLRPDPLLGSTGKIAVDGRVEPVTGIEEKLSAARAAGLRRLLIPVANREEAEACSGMQGVVLIYVEKIGQVRPQLIAQTASADLGFDGMLRLVRSLIRMENLDCIDESPATSFYRFKVAATQSSANLDVYRSLKINVGGPLGAARDAAERVKARALPSVERQSQRTFELHSTSRQARLEDLIVTAGAVKTPSPSPHERWRYTLVQAGSKAGLVLYNTGKGQLLPGTSPAFESLNNAVDLALEGLVQDQRRTHDTPPPPDLDERTPHIGTDEAGKGDYFGPLVCAAVYVDARTSDALRSLGVKDSKKLADSVIRRLAPEIRRITGRGHKITSIPPRRFNELYKEFRREGKNLNTLLAWGHTRSIESLILAGLNPDYAIVDKFADARYIEQKLLADTRRRDLEIKQYIKAESDIAVAAASVLARNAFLEWLERNAEPGGNPWPRGASAHVVEIARGVVARLGRDALTDLVKLNFKTTESVMAP